MMAKGCMIPFWDNKNILELTLEMETLFCEYIKTHLIGHLKWVLYGMCISIKLITKTVKY